MTSRKPLLIITGASSGIGYATAENFLSHGFDVLNISRNDCALSEVYTINLDLLHAKEKTIKTQLLLHISEKRRIVLVHNAALCYNDTINNFKSESWQDTFTLNVSLPALLSQWLLPKMAPHSAIVFVGSTLSEKAVSNTCSYTASKHAVLGLMRSVCQDLAGQFIHTCCVCPGITDTPMLRQRVNNDEKIIELLAKVQSDNRLLQPKEMAEVIYMAATHPVLNGAVLHANGGQIEGVV